MLVLAFFSLAASGAGSPSPTVRETGRQLGKDVRSLYGSPEALEQRIYKPLTSSASMQTIDGNQTFVVRMSCDRQDAFLKVVILPNSRTSDVNTIHVYRHKNSDGSYRSSTVFNGPFAAVCTNGLLLCNAGSTTNCQGRRWEMDGQDLVLVPVSADLVGGCYCYNASCGNDLLTTNREKVMEDIGLGVANVLDDVYPRLSIGDHRILSDNRTMTFSGQHCAAKSDCDDGLDNDQDGLIDHPLDPGCSTPSDPDETDLQSVQPEQHYRSPEGLERAVDVSNADTDSLFYKVNNLDISSQYGDRSCRLSRQVALKNTLRFDGRNLDPDSFEVSTCGPNCREYRIGKVGDNYLSAGGPNSCGTSVNTARFIVNRPDLIQRVTLSSVRYDDFLSIRVNNQLVWSDPVGWMGGASGKPACVENRRARFRGTIDLTRFFTGTAPGGTVQFEQTIYYRAKGEGFSRLRSYRVGSDQCALSENISGNCSSLEDDSRCTLQEEVVDGVTTWDQSRATGRSQDPSERSFSNTEGCTLLVTRPWWEKERTYSCTSDRSGKVNLPACADGDDNDGDGNVDYPNDDGCGSYGDPSEDSEGCTQTGSCVCGSGSDADGLVDVRSDLAICQNLSGRLVCPTDRQQCTRQHFAVWNPSGAGAVEQRQDWVCPAGVEYGCGHDPTDGNVYCSSRPCVNASAPVVTEHDSAGDWPEDRPENIRTDGTCSGRFQIFGGSAKRCRKRGVSTGYQNCCRNRLPPLSDRTGAPGEPNQREYREQHTAIEFWENQCDPEDQESALLNDSGYCIYLGTYCSKKWKWVGCVQKSKSFCCYNSHLAALVHEQVKTVPDDFGPLRGPHCRGFTPEEFQGLDFSKIDLSAYFDSVEMKSGQKIQEQLRTTVRDSTWSIRTSPPAPSP